MLRFAIVLLIGSIAFGQQPTTPAQALQNNPNFRAAAEKTFLQYEDSLSTHCKEITPDWSRAQQTVYVAPVADAQNRVTSGVWSEMVPGVACGQPRNFRALVVIRDGRAGLSRQLPGSSNTTSVLERDVLISMAGALRVHHPTESLSSIDVLDTAVVGANPPAAHQTWKEIWMVRVNGHTMRVAIEFVPDETGGGTSFHIDAKAIVDLPPSGD